MLIPSQNCIDLIQHFEGLKLKVYKDANGLAVGYGHQVVKDDGLALGDTITKAQAERFLAHDLTRFSKGVRDAVKVPLKQHEYDALVSFAYNIGLGNFMASTALKRLNENKRKDAAEAMTWWNKSNGKVLAGLVKRRLAEMRMFLGEKV